jgi:hypothetical protein
MVTAIEIIFDILYVLVSLFLCISATCFVALVYALCRIAKSD